MMTMKEVLSNKISKEQLKSGDHIYSWRNAYLYAHHGIYAGDEKVIHFTRGGGQEIGTGAAVVDRFLFSSSPHSPDNPCPKCGDQSNLDGVISSCIDCFLSGGDLYLFHYAVSPVFFLAKARGGTCTLAKSDPSEQVIHRASYLLLNGFGAYHIFKNNCEDFAIYCKTGLLISTSISVGRSGQAASFLAAASSIVSSPLRYLTTSFSGLAAVGCGLRDGLFRSSFKILEGLGWFYIKVPNGGHLNISIKNNCEDFAIYCKTGLLISTSISVGRSGQAASFLAAASSIVSSPLRYLTTSFSGLAAVGCGMYCMSRLVSDMGVRRDVEKVAVERLVAVAVATSDLNVARMIEETNVVAVAH